jgi:hypothetical protein
VAFSAPSAFIVLIVGSISLGLPLLPALLPTIIVYVLGAFSLAGLGAITGFYSPTPDAASPLYAVPVFAESRQCQ